MRVRRVAAYRKHDARIVGAVGLAVCGIVVVIVVDTDAEDLGGESSVDAEASGVTGVACKENVVLAADTKGRTAVIGVSIILFQTDIRQPLIALDCRLIA